MKKRFSILLILTALALILSACNMPGSEAPEIEQGGDDSMATEIAKILTGTPVQVLISPTAQTEVVEETPEPTEVEETAEDEEVEPTATEEEEEVEPTPTEKTAEEEEVDATATPTATSTPAPTATLADTDPALTLGDPDWVDTMEDGDNWPTGYNEYTAIDFEDGYLKLTAKKDVDGWRLSWPNLEDFYLEVKVQSPECEGQDHFGVMFRVPDTSDANKGYLFGISCDGKYSLRRWDSKTMYYPVTWTAHEAINTGPDAQNTLGVMARGGSLGLYINGKKLTEISDDTYLEGGFGIFVGYVETEDLTVWVDQVRYWENP